MSPVTCCDHFGHTAHNPNCTNYVPTYYVFVQKVLTTKYYPLREYLVLQNPYFYEDVYTKCCAEMLRRNVLPRALKYPNFFCADISALICPALIRAEMSPYGQICL